MNLPDVRLFLPRRLPVAIPAAAILLLVVAFVPIGLILQYRASYKTQPRIHLFQDMDNQPRYEAQGATPLFADGRMMRPRVAHTVPRGGAQIDDALYRGYTVDGVANAGDPDAAAAAGGEVVRAQAPIDGSEQAAPAEAEAVTSGLEPAEPGLAAVTYINGFPDDLTVDEDFLAQGRTQFNTFCYPCHGMSGYGNGPINQRAIALQTSTNAGLKLGTAWVPSANLQELNEDGTLKYGPELYANGKLYNTINNGKGNMVGYGHAINPADRWAIVAYIRALQLTQHPDAMRTALDNTRDADADAVRVADR